MAHRNRRLFTLSACLIAATAHAGDLVPPPGPVTPTMKPLDAIEPRICVNELPAAASAARLISAPGRYYLVADIIAGPGQSGIQVDADDVSIDLNGYSIIGGPGTLDGIQVSPGADRRIRIESGVITEAGARSGSTVRDFEQDGICAAGVSSFALSGVTLENNVGSGAAVTISCDENKDTPVLFSHVTSQQNGATGVLVTNTLVGGIARGGGGGVFCSAKMDCLDMAVCMNGLDGIQVNNAVQLRVEGSLIVSNGGTGLNASVVASDANEGFVDIAYSRSNNNVGSGFSVVAAPNGAGNESKGKVYNNRSTACGNGLDGFHSEDIIGSVYEQCDAAGNGGVGFYKVFQPGNPSYGNITFSQCKATGNALQGAQLELPADSSFTIESHGSDFCANGVVIPSAGLEIGNSGGAPDPAGLSTLDLHIDGGSASQNTADGVRVRADHSVAKALIQNMRAYTNSGSGIDISPEDPGAPAFDVAVRFCDLFCSHNGDAGARVIGSVIMEDSTFSDNTVVGMAISGFPGTGVSHLRRVAANHNAGNGIQINGMIGGDVAQCSANGNGGVGISVGGGGGLPGADPVSGMKIDECYASGNGIGIEVAGENFVLRCGASHSTVANLALDPLVFTGPTVVSPAWTENKPYAWP
ncbi:MAG: hypothetical protein H6813_02375 [Phycisphaeraceae bacterium]|nr:hypothetical protein [Phycisphaeraceae bacterium]MCB9848836.1 hypothetical protein [Phycisphaeraceae bacterium]